MKKIILKVELILCSFLIFSGSYAQNYWVGGTPGQETNWNVAKNWSQNRVPDWSQNVVIPDVTTQSGNFPIVDCAVDPIPHLEIQSNAILFILEEGKMVIDGKTTFNTGIYLLGDLISKGELVVLNSALEDIYKAGGIIVLDNKKLARN